MSKTDLSKFNNNYYKPGNVVVRVFWYCINLLFFLNPWNPFSFIKIFLLRLFGAKVGKGVVIKPNVNIKYPWKLEIGSNVWIGEKVWIDNLAKTVISDNVCVSQGAMLLCGNHNYKKTSFDLIVRQIILEEGVWIGAQSVVCPGVICKSHSILAVGSVATKSLNAYTIYQGNPAIELRERTIAG